MLLLFFFFFFLFFSGVACRELLVSSKLQIDEGSGHCVLLGLIVLLVFQMLFVLMGRWGVGKFMDLAFFILFYLFCYPKFCLVLVSENILMNALL